MTSHGCSAVKHLSNEFPVFEIGDIATVLIFHFRKIMVYYCIASIPQLLLRLTCWDMPVGAHMPGLGYVIGLEMVPEVLDEAVVWFFLCRLSGIMSVHGCCYD